MDMRRLMILITALALAGCVKDYAEQRLRNGLEDVGLSHPMSACMASKMVHQLSFEELQKIGSMGALGHKPLGAMSLDELYYRVRALRDPHILSVTTRAGISCAIDPAH